MVAGPGRRLPPTSGFIALLAILGLAAGGPAQASGPSVVDGGGEWTLVERLRDGIEIFRRDRASSPGEIPEARARVTVDLPVAPLVRTITDYDTLAEFIPYLSESRLLKSEGGRHWIRQKLSLPAPMSDREYVIEARVFVRDEGGRVVCWTLSDWALEPSAAVRPVAVDGSWVLKPLGSSHRTEVTYSIYMDPGGRIPSWVVTTGVRDYIPAVIRAVLRRSGAIFPDVEVDELGSIPGI